MQEQLWFDVGNERYTTTMGADASGCVLWFDVGNERYTTNLGMQPLFG